MYNIKTGQKIYTFDIMKNKTISIITPTPHLNVIGVGTEEGLFALVNLETNEIVLKVSQAGAITAVDCRTDVPYVAIGTLDGKVSVWDLENIQLVQQVIFHTF